VDATGHATGNTKRTGRVPFHDVVVPVHNEEKSIETSLLELSQSLAKRLASYRLIVCEDGSTDKTLLLVRQLSERLPIQVVTDPMRKGHGYQIFVMNPDGAHF
jgi:dolichol-phosphate mannosyltransferase